MHPRPTIVTGRALRLSLAVFATSIVGCASPSPPRPTLHATSAAVAVYSPATHPPAAHPRAAHPRAPVELTSAEVAAPAEAEEHWYFESLSSDGKRALLRELDLSASTRATYHVRVVDVDRGEPIDEITLPELAKIPASTIGGKQTELAALEWMLASPAFARDVARGAKVTGGFPFGECGRLAASPSAIAFDAGDWLYVADASGRAPRRLVEEAAYDPRFTPDGKSLIFRRASGTVDMFAKYELFVAPTDFSTAPRAIPNTAGVRDRFTLTPDGSAAIAITSQSQRATPGKIAHDTCVVSIGLKAPFPVRKLACVDGSEQLVESVISPKGKWAAVSTKRRVTSASSDAQKSRLEWRLRVVSLANGKVVRDEPDIPGLSVRAISDSGLLVRSGTLGVVVHDIPQNKWRELGGDLDLGHRGFFRNDKELVYLTRGRVAVIDVSRE